jgi:hypothetical protein
MEASIAKGEVHYAIGISRGDSEETQLHAAVQAFRTALKIGGRSPRYLAVSYLHLARTYLRLSNRELAHVYFAKYSQLVSDVQNGFTLDLAAKVREELFPRDLLVLDPLAVEPGRGVYATLEEQLREFLLKQYQEMNRIEASERLGISRQTLLNWHKTIDRGPNSRSVGKSKSAAV